MTFTVKQLVETARREYEDRLFTALDEFRPQIEQRNSRYLITLQTALRERGLDVQYERLSLYVKKYREARGIEFRNQRRTARPEQPRRPRQPRQPRARFVRDERFVEPNAEAELLEVAAAMNVELPDE
jgi:hypothetical protein